MSEKDLILIEDILEATRKIESYISGITFEVFSEDSMCIDAVVRNLEIIGETAKGVSHEVKTQVSAIDWKGMAGMRDRLIHAYHSVDVLIVWKTATERLPQISTALSAFVAQ